MEIVAPLYCKDFKCIADKCRHSCCIGWEIDIDEKTYKKYKGLKTELSSILSNVETSDSVPHFALDEKGRCKNLDENGLCKIITNFGEEYLCDICRLHPRFFNEVGGRLEMGIGLSCEEAARIVLFDTHPFELVKIGENDDCCDNCDGEFDTVPSRNSIISFIENEDGLFFEKLAKLEKRYKIKTDFKTISEWIEYLLSLEILDLEWEKNLKKAEKSEQKHHYTKYNSAFEALFKYLVYRHVSIADGEYSFLSRLAFASLSVKLVKYLFEREDSLTEERLVDIVRLFSSEIEYSSENTEDIIFELEAEML